MKLDTRNHGNVYDYDLSRDEKIKALVLESPAFPEIRLRREVVEETIEGTWSTSERLCDENRSDRRVRELRAQLDEWMDEEDSSLLSVSGKLGPDEPVVMKNLRAYQCRVARIMPSVTKGGV